jgi:predicted  nucleic acid-binding Zn-ribbon protein
VLSSKGEAKNEARFAARLDVLMERVDTLASTVATTASAIAKKDGEIAALRRDLDARDQTLQALVAQARQAQSPATGAAVDANELRSLKNAVAALTKEHAEFNHAPVAQLASDVRVLAQRVDELVEASPGSAPEVDPALAQRVDAFARDLESLRASVERLAAEPHGPSEELLAMLATLRSQVEALGGLTTGASGEQLEHRVAATQEALQELSERLDTLAVTVESAVSSLGDKEHELAALHRHFTDSGARIESIVDDIREALHALPEQGATSVDELATRLERIETATRKATEASARTAGELSGRIDVIDRRLATVAEEVSRAKTLWPVALRSLEARLDDAVHSLPHEAQARGATPEAHAEHAPADDLLAGLRDSLQAMETVAAEMARASETLSPQDAGTPVEDSREEPEELEELEELEEPVHDGPPLEGPPETAGASSGMGATIVPLRTGEP